jgi:hypothetical protein
MKFALQGWQKKSPRLWGSNGLGHKKDLSV